MAIGSNKNKPSSNFNPSLHRSRFHKALYPLTVFYLALVLYDAVSIDVFYSNVARQCTNIRNINLASMIYVKSSFNPNLTYVREFQDGALLEVPHDANNKQPYRIGSEVTAIKTEYLFNSQLPSMLARLALGGNATEMNDNFYNVVGYYDQEMEEDR